MILRWNKPSVTKICEQFIFPGQDNVIPVELEEKVKNDPFVIEKMGVTASNGRPLIEIISKTPDKVIKPLPDVSATVAAEGSELKDDAPAAPAAPAAPEAPEAPADEDGVDISTMNVKNAIQVIKQIDVIDDLVYLLETEDRKSVIEVINKQIEKLGQ